MGKKEDKQALNAYQAASMLGAFGQGFATPDSGYGRTAAALNDSALGAIAAQANYMAAKKAKKKGGSVAGAVKGAASGAAAGGTVGGPWGAVIGGVVGGAGGAIGGDTQTVTEGATSVAGAAGSLKSLPTQNPYADFDNTGTAMKQPNQYDTVTGEQGLASPGDALAKSVGSAPTPAHDPVGANAVLAPETAPATPAQTAATTGDWVAPVILGAAGALGTGALINSKKQPLATKAQAAQTTPSAVMGVVAPGQVGGANMTAEQLKLADPITQAAWARDNAGAMTRDHWKVFDAGTKRLLKKQGVIPPASNVQKVLQGRYVYDPNGGTQ